ncbi:MAG TPA: alanine--tRNA ligase, partial [Clostridiales bacterium]|nr:alanine--tRNA ligase [Clostridiales bacterium]
TEVLKIPHDLLWVTVYELDDDAFDIWTKEIGLSPERVLRLGKKDNFWEHGSGPCGPCSEIHIDRGIAYGCGSSDCKPGCDCDRFMEIWNNVFTQFDNDGNGNYTELATKNIDTGMGLERLACILQGVDNLFEVDTVRKILDHVCSIGGKTYGTNKENDISIRVITDHIRSTTFMICDGIMPSNEGRGYVLRRLLRRAARHGKLLGINHPFLAELCKTVMQENKEAYPELVERADWIFKIITMEEERFDATIDAGLKILEEVIAKCRVENKIEISGEDCFRLYDTFGFPIDLIKEIAQENNLTTGDDAFTQRMNEQKQRARAARGNTESWKTDEFSAFHIENTEFTGYTQLASQGKILAIMIDGESVEMLSEGECILILDRTPFYAKSGGQVGDSGFMQTKDSKLRITDTKKTGSGAYLHFATLEHGLFKVGETVDAIVDADRRQAICRNHSSLHMLQSALRQVLGNHVEQAGSYVDDKRGRFDFKHYTAMTEEEITRTEELVNKMILSDHHVKIMETTMEEAKKEGAVALFGEKYGDTVRMVKMGDCSTELCGGTHLTNTAKAGLFKILSEASVSAGVRRIECTTGYNVLHLYKDELSKTKELAHILKAGGTSDLIKKASSLQSELKEAKREIESQASTIAAIKLASLESSLQNIGPFVVLFAGLDGMNTDQLRSAGDRLKDTYANIISILYSKEAGKVTLVAMCGKEAVTKGAHAGNIVKSIAPILGGGGGGRPDSAVSGGKYPEKINEAKLAFFDLVSTL